MISFARDAYDDIIYEAYDGGPEEVCGILAGEHGADESIVREAHPAANVADRPEIRYYLDPEEQFELIEQIEANDQDIVGFYHSHPAGPPYPSKTDSQRATWPGKSYIIVALDGYPYLGSWRWRDDAFDQETVRIGVA